MRRKSCRSRTRRLRSRCAACMGQCPVQRHYNSTDTCPCVLAQSLRSLHNSAHTCPCAIAQSLRSLHGTLPSATPLQQRSYLPLCPCAVAAQLARDTAQCNAITTALILAPVPLRSRCCVACTSQCKKCSQIRFPLAIMAQHAVIYCSNMLRFLADSLVTSVDALPCYHVCSARYISSDLCLVIQLSSSTSRADIYFRSGSSARQGKASGLTKQLYSLLFKMLEEHFNVRVVLDGLHEYEDTWHSLQLLCVNLFRLNTLHPNKFRTFSAIVHYVAVHRRRALQIHSFRSQ
jgi:hypothetical protein